MKRAREEEAEEQEQEQAAPMASSPTTRNLGPAIAAQPSGSSPERVPTMNDAVDFVLSVKHAFDRAKYLEFLDIVRGIDSIGMRGMVDGMKVLLHGHPDLKSQFNMFVPVQYELSLRDDVDQQEEAPVADSLHGRPAHRD